MKSIGIYARVSSEHQAQQATVGSQLEALKQRVEADGHVVLPQDIFVDEGFSGATLVRPALERLRDRAAEGAIEILYVHSPDRLARKYAYQVLLLDGPYIQDGFIRVTEKPGLGIELNPDVVKAHLAPGEVWWG